MLNTCSYMFIHVSDFLSMNASQAGSNFYIQVISKTSQVKTLSC